MTLISKEFQKHGKLRVAMLCMLILAGSKPTEISRGFPSALADVGSSCLSSALEADADTVKSSLFQQRVIKHLNSAGTIVWWRLQFHNGSVRTRLFHH